MWRDRSGRDKWLPVGLTAFAKATSSMRAPLIAAIPPMRSSISRRISTVAARRSRDRRPWVVYFRKRIQHLEEIHERRHQRALRVGSRN